MKRAVRFCVLILAATALAGASWYGRGDATAPAAHDARRILYYVDPMHPAYRSDRPGKAPDCGMDLVPVYERRPEDGARGRDTSDAPSVRVDAAAQRLLGVRVETVRSVPGTAALRLTGRVAVDETRVYRVNAGVDGYIREISTVTTGSEVEKGAWLATMAAPDARTPIQAYVVALDALEQGTLRPADVPGTLDDGLQQAFDRLLTLGMSRQQIDEIRRTRAVPSSIRIVAPAAGFVLARNLTDGAKIANGTELFRIADLRRVWVLADVSGPDAERVGPGAAAGISIPGRTRTFRATVSGAVAPQFDAPTQTTRIRLDVDNPGAILRPDMFVDVQVTIALPAKPAVPVDAVLDGGLRKRVFVERADGTFAPREVETGWRFGDRVEIVRGLSAGERVVVSGTFLLDSESRMRRAPGGAQPPP
jgi:membrane fusion protein, copper/silver efflux system